MDTCLPPSCTPTLPPSRPAPLPRQVTHGGLGNPKPSNPETKPDLKTLTPPPIPPSSSLIHKPSSLNYEPLTLRHLNPPTATAFFPSLEEFEATKVDPKPESYS